MGRWHTLGRMRTSVIVLFFLGADLFAQGTLADYERFANWGDRMRALTPGMVSEVRWIGKTSQFSYTRSTREGMEYMIADPAGQKRAAFDHARLAKALSEAAGKEQKAGRLRLSRVTVAEKGDSVEFSNADGRWRLNLADYNLTRLPGRPAPEGELEGIPGPRLPESTGPVLSPDKKQEAFVRNHNVWLRAKGDAKSERALSMDGGEGDYYTLSVQTWSPDGTKLAVYRVRPGLRRKIGYIESSPADQVQPKRKEAVYAKPGDALDIPRPVLFDVAGGRRIEIDASLFANPYQVSPAAWRKDSRAFTFEYNQRGHQVYRVVEVDAATGRARALVEEAPSTFFCYSSKRFRHDASDGKEIIWMSERDGWNHLYLLDGATGRVKQQITKGPWAVRRVEAVDEERRQIYFVASGVDAGQDPYYRHLFRVNFDGSGLLRLTAGDADHDVAVSGDFRFYTVTRSRVDLAPVTEVRRTADSSLVVQLEAVDASPVRDAGWRPPEVLTAKARDGKTDIWGLIYKPSNFDASRKYPVLEFIYAGPHDSFVQKTFNPAHHLHAMAELGFVVVQVDGMGTSNRSKAFHDVSWKNLGDAGFPDRILWHNAAAAKYAWYGVERLGVYGHSAGGQNAMGALLFHGDFYKVAVSSAGCHDNRMDKIWWNEQWMGWPVGPEYAASSNVEHADKLQGKLLLAVGELDTNVDPASTWQVVNALLKARKTFDLLFVPGAGHGGWGDDWERKRADFLVRHVLGVEPPDWNRTPPPRAAE